MKRCTKCGDEKPLADFHNNRSKPDGKSHICKPCQRTYVKGYKATHQDANLRHKRVASARLRERFPEQERERRREWERAHPERAKARGRAYRARKAGAYMEPWTPEEVFAEYNAACIVCGDPAAAVDHFYSLASGGADALFNLVPMCTPCNSAKRDRDPLEFLASRGIRFDRIVYV